MIKSLSAGFAFMLLVTAALADQPGQKATGVIVSVDAAARTVTLADGRTYVLPTAIQPSAFGLGATVIINYQPDDKGLLQATDVTPLGDPMPTPARSGAG